MSKIVKNTTGSDIYLAEVGLTILASSSYTINEQEYLLWAYATNLPSNTIIPYITAGSLVVNDGVYDLNATYGTYYLKHPDWAFNIRFLSEPERVNGFYKKNVQEAIEESKQDAYGNDLDSKQFGTPGVVTDAYLNTLFNVDSYNSPDLLAYNVYFRKISVQNYNNAGTFTVYLYKVNSARTSRVLVYQENFTGYGGYTMTDQDIPIDEGWSIYVRIVSVSGVKPSSPNVIIWMRQR